MYKGYKIRIYPTKEQEKMIQQHIGAARWMWNYMLELQLKRRQNKEKYLTPYEMCGIITQLRHSEKYSWLNNVSVSTLQKVTKHLDETYQLFFKRYNGFPHFKTKKSSKQKFSLSSDRFYIKNDKYVVVPKIGKIRYKSSYSLEYGRKKQYLNATIEKVGNKYILSFSDFYDNQVEYKLNGSMGIDLGIKKLAVATIDDKIYTFNNINKSKKVKTLKDKIKRAQRNMTRKMICSYKNTGKFIASNNYNKELRKFQKLNYKIRCIRHNYLHQTTTALINVLPEKIVMENLNVQHMMKNKSIRKYLKEQCFSTFLFMMEYKCEKYGINFIKADRYYPSSKQCSKCRTLKKHLKLSERVYSCEYCGNIIDRDINAAINLMRYEI